MHELAAGLNRRLTGFQWGRALDTLSVSEAGIGLRVEEVPGQSALRMDQAGARPGVTLYLLVACGLVTKFRSKSYGIKDVGTGRSFRRLIECIQSKV